MTSLGRSFPVFITLSVKKNSYKYHAVLKKFERMTLLLFEKIKKVRKIDIMPAM